MITLIFHTDVHWWIPDNSFEDQLIETLSKKYFNLSLQLEKHFSGPRDIEWAVKGDEIYLLQVRNMSYFHISDVLMKKREEVIRKNCSNTPCSYCASDRCKIYTALFNCLDELLARDWNCSTYCKDMRWIWAISSWWKMIRYLFVVVNARVIVVALLIVI